MQNIVEQRALKSSGNHAPKSVEIPIFSHLSQEEQRLLNEACIYAGCYGWSVVPNEGKKPTLKDWVNKSTADMDKVIAWWSGQYAGKNIGIVTSNFWALDIDAGADGFVSLDKLENEYELLPDTVTVNTGGGGVHKYFRQSDNPIKNRTGVLPRIDVRGVGGQVIAPPSLHASGNRYEFQPNYEPDNVAIAEAPDWLIGFVSTNKPFQSSEHSIPFMFQDTDLTQGQVQDMLSFIDPDLPYDEWIAVGMALHASSYHFLVWEAWSSNGQKYKKGECQKHWQSFRPGGGITMGTLWHLAKQGGWSPEMLDENPNSNLDQSALDYLNKRKPEGNENAPVDGIEDPQRINDVHSGSSARPELSKGKFNWPQPVDIFAEFKVPQLQDKALPEVLDAFARTEAELLGVDPGGLALAAIVVCAGMIPDAIKIQPKVHDTDWTESARLWGMLVGAPSSRKSPIIGAVMKPVRAKQRDLWDQHTAQRKEYEGALEQYDKDMEKRTKSDEDEGSETESKCSTLLPPMEPFPPRRLYANDTTIEALQEILAVNTQGILIERDELTGWIGAMDKYSNGRGAGVDRAFWLAAYNGIPYQVDRINRGNKFIPNLSACVLGGIQPDVIAAEVSKMQHDGMLQRFLPVNLGPAKRGEDIPIDGQHRSDFKSLIGNLADMIVPADPNEHFTIRFDEAAQMLWYKFVDHAAQLARLDHVGKKFSAWAGKLDQMFARMCLLFHCVEEASDLPFAGFPNPKIELETVRRVDRLFREFLIPHGLRFFVDVAETKEAPEHAQNIAGLILSQKWDRVIPSDLTRNYAPGKSASRRDMEEWMETLAAFGWVEPEVTKIGGRVRAWHVNPLVHKAFQERAEDERTTRKQLQETVLKNIGIYKK